MRMIKKVFKIIGIINSICLILYGIFYFMGLNVPKTLLPIFLIILVFCVSVTREKNNDKGEK